MKSVKLKRQKLDKIENDDSIQFLDEIEYLPSSKVNKEALMNGVYQDEKGDRGKTIKTSELWK